MSLRSPLYGDTFTNLRQAGDNIGEKRDCAVIATAVVTGLPYDPVHTLFHSFGRRNRCGTPMPVTHRVLAHLNHKLHDITKFFSPSSVRSLAPQLPSKGKFLIRTRGHIVAVVDGFVHDWSSMRKLYVQSIYQVLTTDETESDPFLISKPSAPTPRLRRFSIDTSRPTYAVHEIAHNLWSMEQNSISNVVSPLDRKRYLSTFRAKVVAEAQLHGIHKTTASVQVGKWLTANL